MGSWNASQYEKFIKERTLPAKDLAAKIPLCDPKNIIDIGCGPGNSTAVLRERFPTAHIVGADSSEDMLEKARRNYPDMEFIRFDARTDFENLTDKYDVVFSNACIQWIPDHPTLFAACMSVLNKGGVLAVQTPMNYQEPIHKIISERVSGAEWKEKIGVPRIFYNLTQEEYFDLLSELSADFSVWETVYCHRMPSHESIMEWYKGTGLRPYLAALSPADAAIFEKEVYGEIVKAYPVRKNGEILFRFPRFFMVAVK